MGGVDKGQREKGREGKRREREYRASLLLSSFSRERNDGNLFYYNLFLNLI